VSVTKPQTHCPGILLNILYALGVDLNKTQSDKEAELLAKSLMNRRVAQSLQHGVEQFMDYWTDARIVSAHWEQDNLDITVRLPFWLPLPVNGEAGDWPASKRDLRAFRLGIRKQFKEMRLAKISNLLLREYRNFILGYLRIYRFNAEIGKLISSAERRLAGRPVNKCSEVQLTDLKKDVKEIARQLREIKTQMPGWKKLYRRRTGNHLKESLQNAILDWPPFATLSWTKVMFRCFETLPSKFPYKGMHLERRLEDPRSWSVVDWAVLIVQEMSRRSSGFVPAAIRLKSR
jgi:hypothetical protein